ncbi:hypothetical protein AGMMS49959_08270 [Planctomycetales bacterium]|nr:hypothetical protein AGMMS49959_08270 [Planctomycetales bacterium]
MRLSPKQQKVWRIASLSAPVGGGLVLLFRQPLAEWLTAFIALHFYGNSQSKAPAGSRWVWN